MVSLIHGESLVDEQHRNAVVDAIGPAQARVVKEFAGPVLLAQTLVHDGQEWSVVLWTDQDAQQLLVDHDAPG